jgi:hypothetical protein
MSLGGDDSRLALSPTDIAFTFAQNVGTIGLERVRRLVSLPSASERTGLGGFYLSGCDYVVRSAQRSTDPRPNLDGKLVVMASFVVKRWTKKANKPASGSAK